MGILATTTGPSTDWYLTRATGTVSLILLTLSVVLGVAGAERLATVHLPRFVIDSAHRTTSLLAVSFLAVHILTAVLDSYASVSITDAFIPFAGSYRPLWLGLGAVSFDLLIAITITSLARRSLGLRTWRAVHWLAYACWPIALVHALGTGSDVPSTWMLTIGGICLVAVLGAVAVRAFAERHAHARGARVAAAVAICFAIGLALWVPGGPLGPHWARRAGTPAPLLHPAATPPTASTPTGAA